MGGVDRATADKLRPSLAAATATHNVASTAELRAAGLSRDQISHLAAIGFLHPRHRGVWAIGRPDLDFAGRCRAAWLACGADSAISHITAAAAREFRTSTGRIHITVPRTGREHPGLVIHRPRTLTAADVEEHDGYRITTVARTLLDMAPGTPVDTIGRWIHEAVVRGVFDARQVWVLLKRLPRHPGGRRLEAALALEVLDTRSGLEDALLAIWRSAGLPRVVANDWIWTENGLEEVDLHCPSLGLVVEADGGRYHRSRWRRRRDAAKDERVEGAGKKVRRIPELAITLDPAAVAADLRELAATLGWTSSAVSR